MFCEAELGYPCTYRSVTDREGRFSVANLPSGQYVNICAEPPQPTLIASCFWPENPQVGPPSVMLADGQNVSNLRLTLRAGVQLRFEIEDPGEFITRGVLFHLLVYDSARRGVDTVRIGGGTVPIFATTVPPGVATEINVVTPLLMYAASATQSLPIGAPSMPVSVGNSPATIRLRAVPGIVNAASYWPSLPIGGGIASLFAPGITNVRGVVSASQLPLPTELAGTSVTVGGVPVPIFAVANVDGQEQINFQVPDFDGGEVVVNNNGHSQTFYSLKIITPGIFMNGSQPAIQHSTTYASVTSTSPARRGEVIIVYATGLWTTTPPLALGRATPAEPLARCDMAPQVSIGGKTARVVFCGRAPGFVGVDQLNVEVPDTPPGSAELVVIQNGTVSNRVLLPIAD
jgi:uncharacterized protein (TIGR03437 family)